MDFQAILPRGGEGTTASAFGVGGFGRGAAGGLSLRGPERENAAQLRENAAQL